VTGVLPIVAAPGHATFCPAARIIGFAWLPVVPSHLPLAVASDPSRRTVLLPPLARRAGAALGPTATGAPAAMVAIEFGCSAGAPSS
jgi:hypothetical protein